MPHPYIPNSAPEVRAEMLRIIGAKSIEDLYTTVPKELRYNERLPLEEGIPEEGRLRRHVTSILNKNTPASEMLSFLGAGCYQHEVPAVCDEINRRGEFVTSYAGDTYGDHGRLQALWEFQDLMAELVELDVVTTPNYDWSTAAAMALRSSVMLTGRKRVLVPAALLLDRRLVFADYLSHDVQVDEIPFNEETGLLDLDALRAALADDVAAIKVDLTGNNTDGNALLKASNRVTIPLLIVYGRDGSTVLNASDYTIQQVIDAIAEARTKGAPDGR